MIIDLPSSASSTDFPNNTNSSYKIKLPQKLDLKPGEWSVGLLEAHIPNKFYNVTDGTVTFESTKKSIVIKRSVASGFYGSAESIVRRIVIDSQSWNIGDKSGDEIVEIAYDKRGNRATLTVMAVDDYTVHLSEDLCACLGFKHDSKLGAGIHKAPRLCNVFTGLSYLLVYTNLVEQRMVGDSQSPLLRVIPVHGSYGDATHEFKHTHFVDAAGFNSDVVEVNIRTDTGEYAPFVDGKVFLTIELRRK